MLKENKVLKIGGRVAEAIAAKKGLRKLPKLITQFKKSVSEVKWKDLNVEFEGKNNNTKTYYVLLPQKQDKEHSKIISVINSLGETFNQVGFDMLYGGDFTSSEEFSVCIQIDTLNNKIDISGSGIPFTLRNIGFGKKIYKRVISEVGYISSEDHHSYKYSFLLWSGLINDDELFVFMNKKWIYAFLKNTSPAEIIKVLEKVFKDRTKEECLYDEDFVKKHIKLLKASEVSNHF